MSWRVIGQGTYDIPEHISEETAALIKDHYDCLAKLGTPLEVVHQDPNSVEPHTDVIHTKLVATMKDESLPLADRQAAERLFNQMYPEAYNEAMLTDLKRRGVEYEVQTVKVPD